MIDINDFDTWPVKVKDFFERHRDFLTRFHSTRISYLETEKLIPEYDQLYRQLGSTLSSYSILGYHCTRLTSQEIVEILNHGMSLPNETFLSSRIWRLKQNNIINSEISRELLENNDADNPYRKNMLWFCFFEPRLTEESGVRPLFQSWGGEALFRSHEGNSLTEPVLNSIGIPCLIKASLPIKGFEHIEGNFLRKYLYFSGIKNDDDYFEGSINIPLLASDIVEIFPYSSKEFQILTGCVNWSPPLCI